MHKSFAVLSLVASVALAQTTATLIPTGISQPCSDFLNQLNSDKSLSDCTTALVNATSAFAPGSDASTNPSAAKVGTTLTGLCGTSVDDKCADSLIGGKITAFYSTCAAELTSNLNNDVLRNYDVLFAILPFKAAICTKDDSGNYCATQAKLPDSTDQTLIQKILSLPASTNAAALVPNTTTFSNNELPFLFIQKTASSTALCTSCTRNILNAYLNFESKVPYGPGLGKSSLLKSQSDLYTAVQTTCPSGFMSEAGVVKAAGGLSGGTFSSGALQVSAGSSFVFGSMSALLFLVFSSL